MATSRRKGIRVHHVLSVKHPAAFALQGVNAPVRFALLQCRNDALANPLVLAVVGNAEIVVHVNRFLTRLQVDSEVTPVRLGCLLASAGGGRAFME
jgi:hypothetical protein